MNKQREVVYGLRNEAMETDGAAPAGLRDHGRSAAREGTGILRGGRRAELRRAIALGEYHFPAGAYSGAGRGSEGKTSEEAAALLLEKVKSTYELKSAHEEPLAVVSLERSSC